VHFTAAVSAAVQERPRRLLTACSWGTSKLPPRRFLTVCSQCTSTPPPPTPPHVLPKIYEAQSSLPIRNTQLPKSGAATLLTPPAAPPPRPSSPLITPQVLLRRPAGTRQPSPRTLSPSLLRLLARIFLYSQTPKHPRRVCPRTQDRAASQTRPPHRAVSPPNCIATSIVLTTPTHTILRCSQQLYVSISLQPFELMSPSPPPPPPPLPLPLPSPSPCPYL